MLPVKSDKKALKNPKKTRSFLLNVLLRKVMEKVGERASLMRGNGRVREGEREGGKWKGEE